MLFFCAFLRIDAGLSRLSQLLFTRRLVTDLSRMSRLLLSPALACALSVGLGNVWVYVVLPAENRVPLSLRRFTS